jgi:hypothetical protein
MKGVIMSSEVELKHKIKNAFLSYPEPKGLLGINPPGPLSMVDDAMGRCFKFYDGNNKEFISISVVEKQFLPQNIKRYFSMKNPERYSTAETEIAKSVTSNSMSPDETVATDIVESLRQWVSE